MKYQVELDGVTREVNVEVLGETVSVSLDGRPLDVDVFRTPEGVSLILGGRVFDVAIGGCPEKIELAAGGARLSGSALSERMKSRKRGGGSKGGAGDIVAPMPGQIVELAVNVGDKVNIGDTVVVIEAMKMQNELRAEVAGTVEKVEVSVGQAVESDALLMSIKAEGAD